MPSRSLVPLLVGAGVAISAAAIWRSSRRQFRQLGCLSGNARCLLRRLTELEAAGADSTKPFECEFSDGVCHLVVKNRKNVLQKLNTMVKDGVHNLEVITDFDHTISQFEANGVSVPSCHGIMENYPFMTDDDRVFFRELYTKYYAIEICHNMTEEEKKPYMIEWWDKSHQRLIEIKIQKSVLTRTVDESGVVLRDGWRRFFDSVNRLRVPCLIFSAGIGDIIHEIFRLFSIRGPLIRIVSNFMDFDDNGLLRGFTEPVIHTFNKSAAAFVTQWSDSGECCRRNVLLMGDTTGDLRMSEGCGASLVLTVGFLNDKVEQRLPSYSKDFDIVCLRDSTLCVPLAIINAVECGKCV